MDLFKFYTMELNTLNQAIENLTKEQLKNYILVKNKTIFINSPIIYYYKGNFYEGNTKEVREIIKSRGDGKPTKKEVNEAVERLNKKHNKKVLFNKVLTVHYGNHVVKADEIIKPKKVLKEDILYKL